MFRATPELYDLVYSFKDYEAETEWVRQEIERRRPGARTLLDVACGTGKHLAHLTEHYDCEGIDLLDDFVAIATERTGVPVQSADMDDFDLGRQFDAVLCLFSSIGYSSDLDGAVQSMARHLNPDGVLIVEPWFTPRQWLVGHLHVLDAQSAGTRVVRVTHSGIEGNVAVMDMHYVIGDADGVEHRREVHRMTLFTDEEYEAAFLRAGLDLERNAQGPFGRGALIGQPR